MKSRITLVNMLSAFLLQICLIISGLIIPKIILSEFGSDVNGLVCSISEFLNYITLIEGGVTGVVYANLYKPIISKDYDKLSSIFVTARRFFMRIGVIFAVYSVIVAILYPFLF